MSRATEIARRILDESEDQRTGRLRPTEHDLQVAQTYAAVAQAEATERLAAVLEMARTYNGEAIRTRGV